MQYSNQHETMRDAVIAFVLIIPTMVIVNNDIIGNNNHIDVMKTLVDVRARLIRQREMRLPHTRSVPKAMR